MSGNRTDAPPSTALLAAQQELLARRRQRRAERQALGLPVIADEHGRFPHPAPSSPPTNPALPAHLGWHSQAVTAALRRSAPQPQPPTAVSPPAASTPQAPPPPRAPRR
ncbi:MAG: hypothetical protein KC425_11795, partial [Anaerolineales bacterium]|nr:hypothetical protein [Anaerolineales bacterium]